MICLVIYVTISYQQIASLCNTKNQAPCGPLLKLITQLQQRWTACAICWVYETALSDAINFSVTAQYVENVFRKACCSFHRRVDLRLRKHQIGFGVMNRSDG